MINIALVYASYMRRFVLFFQTQFVAVFKDFNTAINLLRIVTKNIAFMQRQYDVFTSSKIA